MNDDPKDFFVVVTIDGPFGPLDQRSVAMRMSEAAMTAADIQRRIETGEPHESSWLGVRVMNKLGLKVV